MNEGLCGVPDAKRLLGSSLKDPALQADLKVWPFKVLQEAGQLNMKATADGKDKKITPQEVSNGGVTRGQGQGQLRQPLQASTINLWWQFTTSD